MIDKIKLLLHKLDRAAELYVSHMVDIFESENHLKNEPYKSSQFEVAMGICFCGYHITL